MKTELLTLESFDMVQKIAKVVLGESEFLTLFKETGSGKTSALLRFYNNHRRKCSYQRIRELMNTTDFIIAKL